MHFYGMGGLTRSMRTSIFSNIQHYAVHYWKLHALSPPLAARCALDNTYSGGSSNFVSEAPNLKIKMETLCMNTNLFAQM